MIERQHIIVTSAILSMIILIVLVDLRSDSPVTSVVCSLLVCAISFAGARIIRRYTATLEAKADELKAKETELEAKRDARHREVFQDVVGTAHRLLQDAMQENAYRLEAWFMAVEAIFVQPGIVAQARVDHLARSIGVQEQIASVDQNHPDVEKALARLLKTRNDVAAWWLSERENIVRTEDLPPNSVAVELTRSRVPYLVRLGDRFQFFPGAGDANFSATLNRFAEGDGGEWPPTQPRPLMRILARDIKTPEDARKIIEQHREHSVISLEGT